MVRRAATTVSVWCIFPALRHRFFYYCIFYFITTHKIASGNSIFKWARKDCRLGDDEFVLVLPEQKDARAALQVARKIIDEFRNAIVFDGHALTITMSLGISLYPDHGADIDTILKNADSAMYATKTAGRNQYFIYEGT
jgi:predicted signal transduction protein with EAL and GGDEF domain